MNVREAEELLPWYVAGTLSHEEMKAVQAFVDSGEIPAEMLEEVALIGAAVDTQGAEEPRYDPRVLQRVLDRLDQVPQEEPLGEEPVVVIRERQRRARHTSGDGGWLTRVLERLQWSMTPPLARVAIAGQFALLFALLVAFTVGEPGQTDRDGYETVSGAVSGDYTLTFAPGITETQVRTLLLENRASIVAGPSAIGLYTIDVDDGVDAAEAARRIEDSGLVTFIQQAPKP